MGQKKEGILRLLSLMRPRSYPYWIGLISMCLLSVGLSVVIAWAARDIIEAAQQMQWQRLTRISGELALAFLGVMTVYPLCRMIFIRCAKRTMVEIRLKVFRRIGQVSVAYYERTHSGDFISRLTNDIQVVEEAFAGVIPTAAAALITGFITGLAMVVLDWRLGSFLILAGVVFTSVNNRFAQSLREFSDRIQVQKARLLEIITDILNGLPLIRMFQLESVFLQKYGVQNEQYAHLNISRNNQVALLESVNYFLGLVNSAGIFAVGSLLVACKMTGFGTLTALVVLQMGLNQMFLQLGQIVANFQKAQAGAARLFEILSEPVESISFHPDDARIALRAGVAASGQQPEPVMPKQTPMIEFCNVMFRYEENKWALDNLSLTVEKGKTAAIVGPSGSGKSTLFKLLLGFYEPLGGQIRIAGRTSATYAPEQLRELQAYVPQESYLFSGTVAENIAFGKYGSGMEAIIAAAKVANAHEFIMELPDGYATDVGAGGKRFSGGQRQRIAIARAVLKDAPILLLDEATSALDSHSEQLVQEALEKLMRGRTVLIIAHRFQTIRNVDVVYTLNAGKMVESGKHSELIASHGLYHDLYNS